MPHDGHDHHGHGHSHGHGRNHHAGDHLHSHMAPPAPGEAIRALAAEFVESFRAAADKAAFLRLAGVPLEIPDGRGGPGLKLVDVKLTTEWQVGAASPAFGTRALSYLPLPGAMIAERANMAFVYVSLDEKREVDLRDFLAAHPGARD